MGDVLGFGTDLVPHSCFSIPHSWKETDKYGTGPALPTPTMRGLVLADALHAAGYASLGGQLTQMTQVGVLIPIDGG